MSGAMTRPEAIGLLRQWRAGTPINGVKYPIFKSEVRDALDVVLGPLNEEEIMAALWKWFGRTWTGTTPEVDIADMRAALSTLFGEEIDAPELKPCPFCGGRAEYKAGHYSGYVICLKCEVMGPNLAPIAASMAWNDRADLADTGPVVDAGMVEAMEALRAVVNVSKSGTDTVAFLMSLNGIAKKCARALSVLEGA